MFMFQYFLKKTEITLTSIKNLHSIEGTTILLSVKRRKKMYTSFDSNKYSSYAAKI